MEQAVPTPFLDAAVNDKPLASSIRFDAPAFIAAYCAVVLAVYVSRWEIDVDGHDMYFVVCVQCASVAIT